MFVNLLGYWSESHEIHSVPRVDLKQQPPVKCLKSKTDMNIKMEPENIDPKGLRKESDIRQSKYENNDVG